jgi:hypothetical protein
MPWQHKSSGHEKGGKLSHFFKIPIRAARLLITVGYVLVWEIVSPLRMVMESREWNPRRRVRQNPDRWSNSCELLLSRNFFYGMSIRGAFFIMHLCHIIFLPCAALHQPIFSRSCCGKRS